MFAELDDLTDELVRRYREQTDVTASGRRAVTRPSPDAIRQELEDRLAELGEFIKSQREIASMSVRRLADLAGVSNPYLSQIERGLRRPSAEILQQLAKALKISVETLYVRAGLLTDDGRRRAERARGDRARPAAHGRAEAGPAQRVRELRRAR